MHSIHDHLFMARALQLARRGLTTTHPNPRVGCVLVKDQEIVAEGWHRRTGLPHAEIEALRAAGDRARGAACYVTLEPCCHHGRTPPCTGALIEGGVRRVVAAMEDPDPRMAGQGLAALRAAGIEVECGVLQEQAEILNQGYAFRLLHGRPWVRLKAAVSLDGRTALASGESRWITGETARRDVQFLRARAAAVMTGIGTVLADDPSLNVRLSAKELSIDGEVRQPLRVVLDTQLRIAPQARLLRLPGSCLVFTACGDASRIERIAASGADVITVARSARGLDLPAVLRILGEREVNEVQLEAGPILNGALLQRELVDEIVLYLAPRLLGDAARGLARLSGITRMEERLAVTLCDVRMVGEDLRITAAPLKAEEGH